MASIDSSLAWFYEHKGKVTYSMVYRNGPSSYDCSSSVYYALIQGGYLQQGSRIGNTDTLFGDLERNGWVQLQPNAQGNFDTKRGDIFIWGKRGASGGAAGHTGQFTNENDVIHCAAFSNGITTTNYDQLAGWNGWPTQTFYRYNGGSAPAPVNPVDQDLEIGSWIIFDRTYLVNDVQNIGGIWQVRTDMLCPVDFTWEDNGIPTEPLYEVNDQGYATEDQDLNVNSQYRIPGKYQVLDLGEHKGRWLALLSWNGIKFWVDVETVTEVSSNHAGIAAPTRAPLATPEPDNGQQQAPVEVPPTPETPQVPVDPQPPVVTLPEEDKPQGEEKMAFTQEQQKELALQQQTVLDANTEFVPPISDRVKTIAYFVTDTAAILSTLIITVLAIVGIVDAYIALAINAAITAALIASKQTFRLSAKK